MSLEREVAMTRPEDLEKAPVCSPRVCSHTREAVGSPGMLRAVWVEHVVLMPTLSATWVWAHVVFHKVEAAIVSQLR